MQRTAAADQVHVHLSNILPQHKVNKNGVSVHLGPQTEPLSDCEQHFCR